MSYKVESDFEHNGYRCVVIFTSMGHRCGYVGVPQTHPLYGVKYHDKVNILRFNDIEDQDIGNRGIIPIMLMSYGKDESGGLSPDCYFDVHGSITYSGKGKYPVESDLWWFGFDCAHACDRKDYNQILTYGLDTPEKVKYYTDLESRYYIEYETIRTQSYVEQECRNLADQLNKFA